VATAPDSHIRPVRPLAWAAPPFELSSLGANVPVNFSRLLKDRIPIAYGL
jgi:hypothetical protein